MLILPTERSVPKVNNPHFLILFGRPKAGKSTLMAALDNNLIIDLENGYQALSALVVQARSVNDFAEIANAIREKTKELGHHPYKYITIDNATRLEEICLSYAKQLWIFGALYRNIYCKIPLISGTFYLLLRYINYNY